MKLELDKINANPKTLEETTKTIGWLINIIIELKKENDWLREQLNNNSNSSSSPLSLGIKKIQKQKVTVRVVDSPDIKAWQRNMVPADQVGLIVNCHPVEKCNCSGAV